MQSDQEPEAMTIQEPTWTRSPLRVLYDQYTLAPALAARFKLFGTACPMIASLHKVTLPVLKCVYKVANKLALDTVKLVSDLIPRGLMKLEPYLEFDEGFEVALVGAAVRNIGLCDVTIPDPYGLKDELQRIVKSQIEKENSYKQIDSKLEDISKAFEFLLERLAHRESISNEERDYTLSVLNGIHDLPPPPTSDDDDDDHACAGYIGSHGDDSDDDKKDAVVAGDITKTDDPSDADEEGADDNDDSDSEDDKPADSPSSSPNQFSHYPDDLADSDDEYISDIHHVRNVRAKYASETQSYLL